LRVDVEETTVRLGYLERSAVVGCFKGRDMDFDEAARAHEAWKARLLAYIGSPDGSLKRSPVVDDAACDLGRWIYRGARREYGDRTEYLELRTTHALFHLNAAQVIRKTSGR
jgi:hypothetical protein